MAASGAFSSDRTILKEIGLTALCLVLAHPLLLLLAGYPSRILLLDPSVPWTIALGTLVFLLLTVLIVLSVWRKRLRLRYEVWQATHGLLTIVLSFMAGLHIVGVGR